MAPKSAWVDKETVFYVGFLNDHSSEAGDGGNFKRATFQKAAVALVPYLDKGPAKDWQACSNKWGALKKTFRIIEKIKGVSGFTWDEVDGASIGPDDASAWDDFVAKNPQAKPYRNKGWPYYDLVADLMPSGSSTHNVFHPLSSQFADADSPPSDTSTPTPTPESDADGDDSGSDNETATPAATSRKRARAPSASASMKPSSKRVRPPSSGAAALMSMSTSIERFGENIIAALATPASAVDPAPVRRTKAISTAKAKEDWLTRSQLLALINIFQKDTAACDVYLTFVDDDELRMDWVQGQINLPSLLSAL
jgi:hypothetical protein